MKENFNKIVGQRLKRIREQLQLTLEEVAAQVSFNNYQTLSSIEDGSRQIKIHELTALAKIYLKDISYFLNPEARIEDNPLILWRDPISVPKLKSAKEQEFIKYCHNYLELEEKFNLDYKAMLPNFNLKADDFSYERSEDIAVRCFNEMQLGSRPAYSLEKILEQKYNIKILYLNLDNNGSAACCASYFGSAILINSSEPLWRRNYDLAHELFHLITWNVFPRDYVHQTCNSSDLIEKWANAFASALLLPAEEVKTEINKHVVENEISNIDLIGVAREFSVSTEALMWRLVSLRYFNQKGVQQWLNDPQIKELDKRERIADKKEAPHISDRYVTLAFKAYQQGLVSKGKLAEYLNIDRNKVEGKLSEYGYQENEVYNGTLALT